MIPQLLNEPDDVVQAHLLVPLEFLVQIIKNELLGAQATVVIETGDDGVALCRRRTQLLDILLTVAQAILVPTELGEGGGLLGTGTFQIFV